MSGVEYSAGKTTDADGNTQYNPGQIPPLQTRQVYFDYGSNQIYVGSVLIFKVGNSPKSDFIIWPGTDVIIPTADYDGTTRIAGIVSNLKETAGVADGLVDIVIPIRGGVYTLAVAVNIGDGEFCDLAAQGYLADGSTTDGAVNVALTLYDENDADNPHGVDAISATIGLVEAIWMGGGLEDS